MKIYTIITAPFKWFMKRSLILKIIIIALIAAGGWFAFTKIGPNGSQQPQYQTAQVEKGTIVASVNASGRVITSNMMDITTGASGVVKKVYVHDGDQVQAGQTIVEITLDREGQQKNAQAWSSYLSAKNTVDTANVALYSLQSQMFAANQKFMEGAVKDNLATTDTKYIQQNSDWLAAESKYKNQQNVINQAQSSLGNAWLSYQISSPAVTAPISGIVRNVTFVEGQIISSQGSTSSTNTSSSQRIAVIQNGTKPILTFDVTEIDVPKVKIDQKVTVTLDSIPDKTFTGKVAAVDRIGTTSNNVTSYTVTVTLDTESPEILPNMAASANIILETKTDVLTVPSTAIQSQNSESTASVLQNGIEQQVPVTTGLSSDTQTEIISGLSEGDTVITGNVTTSQRQQNGTSVFGGAGGGAFRLGTGGGGNRGR